MISEIHNAIDSHHMALKAQYGKVKEDLRIIDVVRKELDGLVNLGDAVSRDDVIKASGRIVGHGFGSEKMATILAGMPTADGQPLSEWVRKHDFAARQQEQVSSAIRGQVGHHLAVAGLRSLAANHLSGGNATPIQSGGMAFTSPNPNALEAQG